MFGISWAEFLVVLLVAILVVPARMWPDVARVLARIVRFVRGVIWKVTDASENLRQQIELEQPIDEIIQRAIDDASLTDGKVTPRIFIRQFIEALDVVEQNPDNFKTSSDIIALFNFEEKPYQEYPRAVPFWCAGSPPQRSPWAGA